MFKVDEQGQIISHLVGGPPETDFRSVTVTIIGPQSAMTADALATVIFVRGKENDTDWTDSLVTAPIHVIFF